APTSPAPNTSRRFSLRNKGSSVKQIFTNTLRSPPSNARKVVNSSSSSSSSSPTPESMPSRHELAEVFKKFDANNDGKISSSELRSMMDSLGNKSSDGEIDSMMKEADADGDGFISFDEFFDANTKGVNVARHMKDLENAFKIYDLDKSGSISVEELFKVLKSLGEVTSLQECRQMIKGVDKNADGFISFEEFKQMMTTPRP
ncbi:hypothetical protein KI387_015557, partial [Taxus chinensis]